jgi:hypothetical protein
MGEFRLFGSDYSEGRASAYRARQPRNRFRMQHNFPYVEIKSQHNTVIDRVLDIKDHAVMLAA